MVPWAEMVNTMEKSKRTIWTSFFPPVARSCSSDPPDKSDSRCDSSRFLLLFMSALQDRKMWTQFRTPSQNLELMHIEK